MKKLTNIKIFSLIAMVSIILVMIAINWMFETVMCQLFYVGAGYGMLFQVCILIMGMEER